MLSWKVASAMQFHGLSFVSTHSTMGGASAKKNSLSVNVFCVSLLIPSIFNSQLLPRLLQHRYVPVGNDGAMVSCFKSIFIGCPQRFAIHPATSLVA